MKYLRMKCVIITIKLSQGTIIIFLFTGPVALADRLQGVS